MRVPYLVEAHHSRKRHKNLPAHTPYGTRDVRRPLEGLGVLLPALALAGLHLDVRELPNSERCDEHVDGNDNR